MIPTQVWNNWRTIFSLVIDLLLSNPITAFVFGSAVVSIIANLIYRIATPKEGNS